MFKVFTTADVIDRMVDSYGEHVSPWLDILELQSEIYYSGRTDDWVDNPEDPWFIVSQRGKDFIECAEYIEAIPKHPERVLEHPDAAFLLNVDECFALGVERAYGVICQSVSRLDCHCIIAEYNPPWTLRKNNLAENNDPIRTCWKDLLGNNAQDCPSNALIVIDRNFFSDLNKKTGELFGIEGLADFLDTILPKTLKCEYQVLIVFEEGHHYDPYPTEQEFVDEKGQYMTEKFRALRDYPIRVELLSVSRRNSDREHYKLFLDTHNRRLMTNYYYLGAELSLSPFYKGTGPRVKQDVKREYLYSDYQRKAGCDLAVREIKDIEKLAHGLITADARFHWSNGPIQNRLANYPQHTGCFHE